MTNADGRPMLTAAHRDALIELAPVVRRAVQLDPRALIRLRFGGTSAMVLARLPFGVLVSRTVRLTDGERGVIDTVVPAAQTIEWLDDPTAAAPRSRDAEWRTSRPPDRGWQRLDTVPDDVVRGLVRQGALALKDAAAREGVPGAQPRAEVADALLDSVVLTVHDHAGHRAAVTLRALSALTRMGFLPRGGQVFVDVVGRWIRVVGGYGTVYLEQPGAQLTMR